MFSSWLVKWPSLSLCKRQTNLPTGVPLSREWSVRPSSSSSKTSSSSAVPARKRDDPKILCPLQGLSSLSVYGPLACQFVVCSNTSAATAATVTSGSTTAAQSTEVSSSSDSRTTPAAAALSSASASSIVVTAASAASGGGTQAGYEDSLAQLHVQLLQAVSAHQDHTVAATTAVAASGNQAPAAATPPSSKRRKSSSTASKSGKGDRAPESSSASVSPSPPPRLLTAGGLLDIVQQCHDLWKLALEKGFDVDRTVSVAVEHLAQLLQVMSTAGFLSLKKDHLERIRTSLPSNRLLDTVLEFQANLAAPTAMDQS
eukprot:scpid84736/ scgid12142/ 